MSLFIFHYCTQCALGYLLKLSLTCNNHILYHWLPPQFVCVIHQISSFLTQTVPPLSIKLIQLIFKVKVEVNRESTKLFGCYKLGLNQKSTVQQSFPRYACMISTPSDQFERWFYQFSREPMIFYSITYI